ncbi:Ribosomal protein S6 kinase [Spraguea lophii 42_110]|uniref:Ribosomal protein S6 kinase n=1 Tax=Spraguea lophii (strain 42_110) TaxID=1358809 RepID=S7WAI8_SPRLO|nr:Ribosomal protein S6 kinase [Spraguea lophii 42_110]
MLLKEDLNIISILYRNKISNHNLVVFEAKTLKKSIFFEMRVTNKKSIVENDGLRILKKEYDIRKKIRNVFLVNFISSFHDLDFLYYITEIPKGGFFYYYLREREKFSKQISKFYIAQIALGIEYLHSKNITYKLLTPDTIMLTKDGNIKLRFDFLNSYGLEENEFKTIIEYIPVDYVKDGIHIKASDFWSIGIILYEFLTGQTPFKGINYDDTVYKILSAPVNLNKITSSSARDLISKLLERCTRNRLGGDENGFHDFKKHTFFKNLNWNDIAEGKIRAPIKTRIDSSFRINTLINIEEKYIPTLGQRDNDGYGSIFRFYGKKFLKDKDYTWQPSKNDKNIYL